MLDGIQSAKQFMGGIFRYQRDVANYLELDNSSESVEFVNTIADNNTYSCIPDEKNLNLERLGVGIACGFFSDMLYRFEDGNKEESAKYQKSIVHELRETESEFAGVARAAIWVTCKDLQEYLESDKLRQASKYQHL
jgi:hypothetical protein